MCWSVEASETLTEVQNHFPASKDARNTVVPTLRDSDSDTLIKNLRQLDGNRPLILASLPEQLASFQRRSNYKF
jgi:hypothetical protein